MQRKIPKAWQDEIDKGGPKAEAYKTALAGWNVPPKAETLVRTPSGIGTRLHAIIKRETGNEVPCSDCKAEIDRLDHMTPAQVLKQAVPLADSIVARGQRVAAKWHQRLAARLAPSLVSQIVRSWIVEACEIRMLTPPQVPASEVIVGTVHEGNVKRIQAWAKPSNIPIKLGNLSPHFDRRIITTTEYEELVRKEVKYINGGFDRVTTTTPWVADRWAYSVTTVPTRINSLPSTLESLEAAGFDDPVIAVDGPNDGSFDWLQGYTYAYRGSNIGPYAHWYLTLQEMYLRDPWCQYYAIFQDDFVCVRNLRAYLTKCTYPEKGYWNLFTFMENDDMVQQVKTKGWVPAARAAQGYQLGRGAVALVFSHEAVQVLLNSPHMKTRVYDSQKGFKSIDGAVVTAMHHAGWTEFVHNPSLVQHTGEVSSIGNRKHPLSKCFDPDFDPMS